MGAIRSPSVESAFRVQAVNTRVSGCSGAVFRVSPEREWCTAETYVGLESSCGSAARLARWLFRLFRLFLYGRCVLL